MTARDIQRRLISDRYHRNFVLPNYTPKDWFECDVLEITRAGLAIEYEIKLSASDFRADQAKRKEEWQWSDSKQTGEYVVTGNKHQLLSEKDTRGPSRFWFVLACPDGPIVPDDQIPAWAGIIHARPDPDLRHHCWLEYVRPAPKLHRTKIQTAVKDHAQSVCYWRFIRLFLKAS